MFFKDLDKILMEYLQLYLNLIQILSEFYPDLKSFDNVHLNLIYFTCFIQIFAQAYFIQIIPYLDKIRMKLI